MVHNISRYPNRLEGLTQNPGRGRYKKSRRAIVEQSGGVLDRKGELPAAPAFNSTNVVGALRNALPSENTTKFSMRTVFESAIADARGKHHGTTVRTP